MRKSKSYIIRLIILLNQNDLLEKNLKKTKKNFKKEKFIQEGKEEINRLYDICYKTNEAIEIIEDLNTNSEKLTSLKKKLENIINLIYGQDKIYENALSNQEREVLLNLDAAIEEIINGYIYLTT